MELGSRFGVAGCGLRVASCGLRVSKNVEELRTQNPEPPSLSPLLQLLQCGLKVFGQWGLPFEVISVLVREF